MQRKILNTSLGFGLVLVLVGITRFLPQLCMNMHLIQISLPMIFVIMLIQLLIPLWKKMDYQLLLVNHCSEFRLRYECCFLWVDVSLPVLHSSLQSRVDRMIVAGLSEFRNLCFVCEMFDFFIVNLLLW
jgi:hypothetical protein